MASLPLWAKDDDSLGHVAAVELVRESGSEYKGHELSGPSVSPDLICSMLQATPSCPVCIFVSKDFFSGS